MTLPWRIELFGRLQARRGERSLTHFGTRKAAALLAYLALFPDCAHPREVLAELLWPEEDAEATRDRFRQALSTVRRLLEPEGTPPGSVLAADRTEVHLLTGAITTDVGEFEALLGVASHEEEQGSRKVAKTQREKQGDTDGETLTRRVALERAVALYRGELLPGYYEEWIVPERERLAEAYRNALYQLAAEWEREGDLPQALEVARRAVAADPLREDAHGNLMRLYAASGRLSDAVRQYRELERVLKEQLGSVPSPTTQALFAQLRAHVPQADASNPTPAPPVALVALEPEGGAVPLDSSFYLLRSTDEEFESAIARRDSIVLVKGARQMGKTSLLARGLQQARQAGAKIVLTDLQKLTSAQMATADTLFFHLAEAMAEQLELEVALEAVWNPQRGWNVNFERFLRREVLGKVETHVVWGLDEVDRLFGHPFSTEVFGLFRSWHNERSLNPGGPWSRLTLAIAYATEAHLFITDLNQSPFNVGTRLALEEFSLAEVAEVNRRYASPLKDTAEVARYYALVGGNPYLVRRGLHAMATQGQDIAAFELEAEQESGVFGDHLRRMVSALGQDAALCEAVRTLLKGELLSNPDSFYRLRSAGIVVGRSTEEAQLRCRLYRNTLRRYLL
ncbi:MAG TPA: AAA-like domain-containing protein [Chthonomonadaceae bacterium]|nr:AAA-like domain-containing protein [Chthonomonadaceae bacterium]